MPPFLHNCNGQANGVYYNDIQMHIVLSLIFFSSALFTIRFLFDLLSIKLRVEYSDAWLQKLRKPKRIIRVAANNEK